MVEIAAGLSPARLALRRALWRAAHIYRDRPARDGRAQAGRRSQQAGSLGASTGCCRLDALSDDGEHSLASVAAGLEPRPAASPIITEGLLSYLDRDAVLGLWGRIARISRLFLTA